MARATLDRVVCVCVCVALIQNPDLTLLIVLYYMIVCLMLFKTVWDTKCLVGFWLVTGKLQEA